MLCSRTHAGNSSSTQGVKPTLISRTTATGKPSTAIRRGITGVRNVMIDVLSVDTAAIRVAYARSSSPVTWRPMARVSGAGAAGDPDATSVIRPSARAAATNSMATNSRPLPRNKVAKNWSSRGPIRSRATPMNPGKVMPAIGTRFSVASMAVRCALSVSHSPGLAGFEGTETLVRTSARRAGARR